MLHETQKIFFGSGNPETPGTFAVSVVAARGCSPRRDRHRGLVVAASADAARRAALAHFDDDPLARATSVVKLALAEGGRTWAEPVSVDFVVAADGDDIER